MRPWCAFGVKLNREDWQRFMPETLDAIIIKIDMCYLNITFNEGAAIDSKPVIMRGYHDNAAL